MLFLSCFLPCAFGGHEKEVRKTLPRGVLGACQLPWSYSCKAGRGAPQAAPFQVSSQGSLCARPAPAARGHLSDQRTGSEEPYAKLPGSPTGRALPQDPPGRLPDPLLLHALQGAVPVQHPEDGLPLRLLQGVQADFLGHLAAASWTWTGELPCSAGALCGEGPCPAARGLFWAALPLRSLAPAARGSASL